MSFLKQRFAKNNCRMCKKTFCCQKCRGNHETDLHNIFPDCDICLYGKIYISSANDIVLEHIKRTHWPLNCIYCKRLFGSLNELQEHIKCPIGPPQSFDPITKTPMRSMPSIVAVPSTGSNNFSSPPVGFPISNMFLNMAGTASILPGTSTPMQAGDKVLDCFPDNITPVDNNEKREAPKNKILYANENLSSWTPNINDDNKKTENYNKRKVTFNETPLTEHTRKKPTSDASPFLKASLKKHDPCVFNFKANISLNVTDVTVERTPTVFETPDNKVLESINEINENGRNECIDVRPIKKRRSSTMNETLWESAISFNSPDVSNVVVDPDDFIKKEVEDDVCIGDDVCNGAGSYIESSTHEFGINTNIDSHYSYIDNACGSFNIDNISKSSERPQGSIWSSMTHLMKDFVKGFSETAVDFVKNSNKRHLSDSEIPSDLDRRQFKRIKLTDIKCRPSIRTRRWLRPVQKVDKSTQTEES